MKHQINLVKQEDLTTFYSIMNNRVKVTNKFLNKIEKEELQNLQDAKECLIEILAHTTKSDREFLIKEIEAGHINGTTFLDENKCGCVYGTIFKKHEINLEKARTYLKYFDEYDWNRHIINNLIKDKLKLKIPNSLNDIEHFLLETYPGLTNKNYIPLALVHKWIEEYDQ